jgi:hypothetical protein
MVSGFVSSTDTLSFQKGPSLLLVIQPFLSRLLNYWSYPTWDFLPKGSKMRSRDPNPTPCRLG